jgi:hypothetical protein
MYQSFDMVGPARLHRDWSAGAPITTRADITAGAQAVEITPAAMTGIWSLRFGLFGCPDAETHGGLAFLGPRTLSGGDAIFAYHGRWTLEGTEFTTLLHLIRHGMDGKLPAVFAGSQGSYHLDCTAEAITPDLFEGRLRRPGLPDARLVMRRRLDGRGGLPFPSPEEAGFEARARLPVSDSRPYRSFDVLDL